jgi:hypothetical protein
LCIHSASFTAAPGVLKLPAAVVAVVRVVVEGGLAVEEAGLAVAGLSVAGLETLDLCRCRAWRDE